jgi:ABC-type Fe3+/spermidine/putrescine transport system ATPase subunit
MSTLQVSGLVKTYDGATQIGPISFSVGEGEFFSLLGPSGCGKSTSLRCIAGFERPDSGRVLVGNRDVLALPPHKRELGIVFQNYALFPHLDVLGNVGFGLRRRRVPVAEANSQAQSALELVGLGDFGRRMPHQLSGGQQQRVALARAFVLKPPLLLMDEPLSSLDLKLREQMRLEIRALQQRLGLTLIYVTHDQDEALAMSDRIAVLSAGQVQQIGPPREIYERPANEFVARFIGSLNLWKAEDMSPGVDGAMVARIPGGSAIRIAPGSLKPGVIQVGIRPERLRILPPDSGGGSGPNMLDAEIDEITYLGENLHIRASLPGATPVQVSVKNVGGVAQLRPGQRIKLECSADDVICIA